MSLDALNFSFTCTDVQGEEHTYTGQKHPAREGMTLYMRWSGMVLEPLAAALNLRVSDLDVRSLMGGQAKGAINFGLDGAAVGKAVRSVMSEDGIFDLVSATLRYSKRDGAAIANDNAFELAYRGNLDEFVTAGFKAAQANGFFGRLGGLIDSVPSMLQKVVEATKDA